MFEQIMVQPYAGGTQIESGGMGYGGVGLGSILKGAGKVVKVYKSLDK